jgi:copper chaperone NosL
VNLIKTTMGCLTLGLFLMLGACSGDEVNETMPDPVALTGDDLGYFCGMTVNQHNGPKGQIFLKGQKDPIWFVSVRDALAFTKLPDEAYKVKAIYLTDMGKAITWDHPGDKSWFKADGALFVSGSSKKGGMGGGELIPFSSQAAADAFMDKFGGVIIKYKDVTDDMVLGDGDAATPPNSGEMQHNE